MNQQGHLAAQTSVRPPNVGLPFYPPTHPRNGPRLSAPVPAGFSSQPTLTAPPGSQLLPPQVGQQSQMYTLVYNVNSNRLPNAAPVAPAAYAQSYPGQEQIATYQNQPLYYQPINQPYPSVGYPPGTWTALTPQQSLAYTQQQQYQQQQAGANSITQQPPPNLQPYQQQPQQQQPQPQQSVAHQKRERHPLVIIDPLTQKNVIEDELKSKKQKEGEVSSSASSSSFAAQQQTAAGPPAAYQPQQFVVPSGGQQQQQMILQQQMLNQQQHYHSAVANPVAHYSQQSMSQQQPIIGVVGQQQAAANYQQNVQNYQKSVVGGSSDDQHSSTNNSQTNSRGQTPLSGAHTPTERNNNYSPGPPPAPNITAATKHGSSSSVLQPPTDQASQVYCELALNIARQVTATTTPPPPTSSSSSENLANLQQQTNISNSYSVSHHHNNNQDSNDNAPSSSHASVTLLDKSSKAAASVAMATAAVTSLSYSYANSLPSAAIGANSNKTFAAAAKAEPKPKDILNQSNPDLGVEKTNVDVTFGFFDSTTTADNSLLSKDDSSATLPRTPVLPDDLEIAAPPTVEHEQSGTLPTSMSTPIKGDERKHVETVIPEIESNDAMPTFFVSQPSPTSRADNEQAVNDEADSMDQNVAKSADVTVDTSVEDGELRDSEDDSKAQPGSLFEKEILNLRATRSAETWSVDNTNGKKVYSREYMYAIREMPFCKESPEFPNRKNWLPDMNGDLVQARRGPSAASPRDSKARGANMGGIVGGNAPFHLAWQIQSPSQKPAKYPGRSSQQRNQGQGTRGSQQKQQQQQQQQMIIPRPSFNADVQLKKAEHAWKPNKLKVKAVDPDTAETEELYRKVKSILNKITPQTFDELSNDFLALEQSMNTAERTLGVIDIVFAKVCDEPNFCETYGRLCEMLTNKQNQMQTSQTTAIDKKLTFRYQLLTKCQKNFDDETMAERLKEEKLKEIENAETEEIKNKLKADLEETLVKHKWRTLGSIRFVGELYKRKLLTKFIAQVCIQQLLRRSNDDESVECLCKLFTTIGKMLEEDNSASKMDVKMDLYIEKMKDIMEAGIISKRIQFEIRNLLELRDSKWVPRRKEAGPKRIDEIHKEAHMEEVQQKMDIQQHQERQKQQQFTGRGSQQAPRGQQNQQQRGVPSRGSYGPTNDDDYNRQRGGAGQRGPVGSNRGNDRDQQDRDNRMMKDKGGRGGPQMTNTVGPQDNRNIAEKPLSKHLSSEVSLAPQRSFRKPTTTNLSQPAKTSANRFDHFNLDDRGSAPSSRESSQTRATPTDRQAALEAVAKISSPRPTVVTDEKPSLPMDQMNVLEPEEEKPLDFNDENTRRLTKETFDEYVVSGVYEEVERFVTERKTYIIDVLQIWLECVLDKSSKERAKLGELIGTLLSKNVVRISDVADGFDQFVPAVESLETDIPLIWPYLGEILGAILNNRGPGGDVTSRLKDFQKVFKSAGRKSQDLLAHTLLTVQSGSSEQNLQAVWSSETWQEYDFKDPAEVDGFLNKHKLNCLSDLSSNVSTSCINSIDPKLVDLERHVKSMDPVKPDELISWIDKNLTDTTSDEFVRALTRSLCSKVFVEQEDGDYSLQEEQFEQYGNVFRRYITARQNLEVTLLLELADYYYNRGCPREFLAEMYSILSDSQVISRESFEEWWRIEGQLNKHGMILKSSQINRFMESQRSTADDSSSSNESESTAVAPAPQADDGK